MFYTWVACEPDDTADNLARLREIFEAVERDGITPDELTQAKNKVKARVVLGNERPRSRLFNVGGNWLQRREYRAVADDLNAVNSVTLDDVLAVIAKYPLSQYATATVGPLEKL
jgi:predicted Zn-dependent peptidase